MKRAENKINILSFSFFVPLIWGQKMKTEKGDVIGMRKEALGVRKKLRTLPLPTLQPPFTHPLPTLCRPCFRKRM